MRISDVMTKVVETVGPAESAEMAWERMRSRKFRHLVVMDRRSVVGVISERDLGGRAGESVREGKSVADLMTRGVFTAAPDDTIKAAANKLRGHSLGCLPVLDDGELVGLLTVSDVLELVGRGSERPVERGKRYTLKNRGPKRG